MLMFLQKNCFFHVLISIFRLAKVFIGKQAFLTIIYILIFLNFLIISYWCYLKTTYCALICRDVLASDPRSVYRKVTLIQGGIIRDLWSGWGKKVIVFFYLFIFFFFLFPFFFFKFKLRYLRRKKLSGRPPPPWIRLCLDVNKTK